MSKSARGLFSKLTALILVVLGCRGYPQMMASFGSGGTVTVATSSSQIPAIPANAVTFANLQDPAVSNPGSWTICNANNNCGAGTPNCIGDASLTNDNSSPALSTHGSLHFINTTDTGTATSSGTTLTWASGPTFNTGWAGNPISYNGATYTISSVNSSTSITLAASAGTNTTPQTWKSTTGCNTLVYRHLSASWTRNDSSGTLALGSITNAILDEWVYVNYYSGTIGPEWDPDIFLNSTETTKASIACYASQGGKWDLYDQSANAPTGGNWTATSLSCPWATTGAGMWHHIRLWITFNQPANTYTYQELDVDGAIIFSPTALPNVGPTFNSLAINQGNELNVEFQLDNNSTSGSTDEYLDNINFTVW